MRTTLKLLMIRCIPPAVLAAAAAVAISSWLAVNRGSPGLTERRPLGRAVQPGPPKGLDIAAVGRLETLSGRPADLPGKWPRFRGAEFDNVARDAAELARTWPPGGPPRLWEVKLGEGYAAPAVLNGRVYLLDYDRQSHSDVVRCLSLADGRDIWRFSYPVRIKRQHGMSRTIPAVTDKYVLGLGPKCHVTCLDAITGKLLWAIDLVGQYGTKVPPWYAGQCPLIDAGKAILAPGGPDALLLAVDCATGEVIWKTPNPRRWGMTHSSVMPMELAGQRMYLYCATGGVVAVSADDGRVLWQYDDWKVRIANVPSPVVLPGGRVLLTGGYNAGAVMLRIRREGGRFAAEELFRLGYRVFGSAQQTPIYYKGLIYGIPQDGQLVCLDPAGTVRWRSGSEHTFGLGPFLIADELIFILDDEGTLTLAQASPAGYRQLARAKVLPGPEAWGPMALVNGRLLLRDLHRMVCLDVRAGSSND